MAPTFPPALSARLDVLRHDPAALSELERSVKQQFSKKVDSGRRAALARSYPLGSEARGPALRALLSAQRMSSARRNPATASPRVKQPAVELVEPPSCGEWADAVITRARGLINHDSMDLQDPRNALLLRRRVKNLERAGPMTYAPPSETERIVAASVQAAHTPRERPNFDAQARITADWQPSLPRRPGVAAAYWKGPDFAKSGRVSVSASADGMLYTRHRMPYIDYLEQQSRIETTRQREHLKEMPLTPRSARDPPLSRRRARVEALRIHRAEINALGEELDGAGIHDRDVALERMMLSTGLSIHRKRPS